MRQTSTSKEEEKDDSEVGSAPYRLRMRKEEKKSDGEDALMNKGRNDGRFW